MSPNVTCGSDTGIIIDGPSRCDDAAVAREDAMAMPDVTVAVATLGDDARDNDEAAEVDALDPPVILAAPCCWVGEADTC